jgi:cytochrome c oxidase cbb3-type subunit 3
VQIAVAGIALATVCAACTKQSVAVNSQNVGGPPAIASVGPVPGPTHTPSGMANPFADNAAARATGRDLFVRYNCSGCHGGHAGGGMGPSLRDEDWIYGHADAQIFDSIAQGRANGMPAWGTLVPANQIWQLVTYIESLRTPDEPQPPS